jgi:regulatory protein
MKNLKLKQKNKRNYIVILDELPQGELPVSKLRSLSLFGNLFATDEPEVDQKLIDEIIYEITNYAWQRLLNWLAMQERSLWECRRYLQKLSLNEDIAANLLEKAQGYNYINDERFAELYIHSLIENGKSYNEIKAKLRMKISDSELLDNWLHEHYSRLKQTDVLKSNIKKLSSRWTDLEPAKRLHKMIEYLSRRGFNYYEIKDAIASLEEEYENDDS